ncbi:hypothetical protein CGCS363_v011899 [Colletotrichum siamense]|uniref:uncharacterized protein n=1 Tax=Colletotrichum siamense TaxID=690259 RepID=UPI0018733B76|nr:uncharacterized protein CGCS363_v011899 [Colletotrichum siamense]KAF5489178.1 hypothetical protein CGCS363_v011899 [Colletotrichum siamense]
MRHDLLEMFLDDAGGFEKCLGLEYASHDAGIEDSIRNPDPLLDRMGPITDRLFSLSLADDYDYGGELGARIKAGGFVGEAMPHPQISLQESVLGLSCREDGVLQRSNGYGLVAPEERRSKVKTQSTTIYDDYNHNFDGVAPDPTTAGKKRPLDIESVLTDGLAQELEEEKRKKMMQVVETLVIKVLQQPLVAKDTNSGKALVEAPEDERSCNEQQTAESNAKSFSSDSSPPTQALRPPAAPEVGVDSHDHKSQSISDGALINTPEEKGNAWLPTDFYDFDFGDESNLQRWPGWNSAFVEGNGYEWAAIGATASRMPHSNQILDCTTVQGNGNLSQSDLDSETFDFGLSPDKCAAVYTHLTVFTTPSSE